MPNVEKCGLTHDGVYTQGEGLIRLRVTGLDTPTE